jgi:hypothetical protein
VANPLPVSVELAILVAFALTIDDVPPEVGMDPGTSAAQAGQRMLRQRLSGTIDNCGPNYSKGRHYSCLNIRHTHGPFRWRTVAIGNPEERRGKLDMGVQQNLHGASRILDHPVLGNIADTQDVIFSFDGVEVVATEGEPIASALLAAGFRVLRTMPESDAPRGGYCMVGRCSDCQMVVDGIAGVRTCVTPARPGMVVQTQLGVGHDDIRELMGGAE